MSIKPPYTLCPICNRFPRGWGYTDPRFRMASPMGRETIRSFCSQTHQQFYHRIKQQHGEDVMIDPTGHEIAAMRSAIKPLSEYIEHEMGWETPLSDYDRDEILTLIEVVVTAYHESLIAAACKHWPEQVHILGNRKAGEHSDVGL